MEGYFEDNKKDRHCINLDILKSISTDYPICADTRKKTSILIAKIHKAIAKSYKFYFTKLEMYSYITGDTIEINVKKIEDLEDLQ